MVLAEVVNGPHGVEGFFSIGGIGGDEFGDGDAVAGDDDFFTGASFFAECGEFAFGFVDTHGGHGGLLCDTG